MNDVTRARRARALLGVVVLVLLAGLTWGLTTSPAASGSPAPSPTNLVLKVGYLTPPENLNPFVGYTNSDYEIWCLNYDYLVGYAPDGSPRPAIATSWSTTDDGKAWIFHISHGVTWQDGVPLTARDVAFTFNHIVKKKLAAWPKVAAAAGSGAPTAIWMAVGLAAAAVVVALVVLGRRRGRQAVEEL